MTFKARSIFYCDPHRVGNKIQSNILTYTKTKKEACYMNSGETFYLHLILCSATLLHLFITHQLQQIKSYLLIFPTSKLI